MIFTHSIRFELAKFLLLVAEWKKEWKKGTGSLITGEERTRKPNLSFSPERNAVASQLLPRGL